LTSYNNKPILTKNGKISQENFVTMSNQEQFPNLIVPEKETQCHRGFYGKNYRPYLPLCGSLLLGIGVTFSPSVLATPATAEIVLKKDVQKATLEDQTEEKISKKAKLSPTLDFKPQKPQFSSSSAPQKETKKQFQPNRFSWEYNPSPRSVTTEFDWLNNDPSQNSTIDHLKPEPIIPGISDFPEVSPENNLDLQPELTDHQEQSFSEQQPELITNQETSNQFYSELTTNQDESETEQVANSGDPELGILRLRELPKPPTTSAPKLYLMGGLGYIYGDNIFSLIDPVGDSIFSGGLTLLFTQMVDPNTSISASVGGGFNRYVDQSEFDYNQMRLNLNLYRQVTKKTYFEFGWTNQQLFNQSDGDRFLNDHSAYFQIGRRDWLQEKVYLDSYYQFRRRFADPGDRSQTINALGLFFGYNPYQKLKVGLGYSLGLSGFVEGDRYDVYHQLIARLSYSINDNSRVYLFGGGSFGNSNDDLIDFNSFIFGVGIDFNINIF
jgi:hypothetical protein